MPVSEAKKQFIMQSLQSVRDVLCRKLRKPVINTDIMETLFETWNKSNDVCDTDEFKSTRTYTNVKKSQVIRTFFYYIFAFYSKTHGCCIIPWKVLQRNT